MRWHRACILLRRITSLRLERQGPAIRNLRNIRALPTLPSTSAISSPLPSLAIFFDPRRSRRIPRDRAPVRLVAYRRQLLRPCGSEFPAALESAAPRTARAGIIAFCPAKLPHYRNTANALSVRAQSAAVLHAGSPASLPIPAVVRNPPAAAAPRKPAFRRKPRGVLETATPYRSEPLPHEYP